MIETNHITEPFTLSDLPEDIFLQILSYLDAWDVVLCQKVSRSWRQAFSKDEHLHAVLKKYPLAREVRELDPDALRFEYSVAAEKVNWPRLFTIVTSRYYHLTHGKAQYVIKYRQAPLEQFGHWYPVGQWDYHESQPGGRLYYENVASHLRRLGEKPYLFRCTLWSYDDGLVVFSPADMDYHSSGQVLSLLDIQMQQLFPLPFTIHGKIIRNLRLKDRTLVIEWAEKDPFHALNDMEQVNRHFASCFDIRKEDIGWEIAFRSEWKIHFLGLPLNTRDRFFSTHNSQHYAVYFWQPNRSMYTGDEEAPIESLTVFDISQPSSYLPSQDPSGKKRPIGNDGPHVVSRFPFNELDFLGIRQRATISLMSLHLDSKSWSLTIRENIFQEGQGYFDPAERLWDASTTLFPFIGSGPRLWIERDGQLPPYRGHCSMESSDVEDSERWFVPVMDVIDSAADVRLSLVETCFTGQSVENRMVIRIKALDNWVSLEDTLTNEVSGMGRIAGDERWIIGQNESMDLVILQF